MPTYSYACTACEHRFDTVQAFADSSLIECPECTGRLRKLYSSVGIVFKGSGFYRNDSRAGGSGEQSDSSSESGSGSDSKSESGSKSDSGSTTSKSDSESGSKSDANSGKSESKAGSVTGSGSSPSRSSTSVADTS